MPSRRAAIATPRAWLPEEKATTPRARASGESWSRRFVAPRSLNAAPVCRHSHLSQTRPPPTSLSTSGVRSTSPPIRSAAAAPSGRAPSGAARLVGGTLPEAVQCFMHPVKAEEAIAEAYFRYGVKTFSLDTLDELEKIVRATSTDGVAPTDLNLLVRISVDNGHA